MIETPNPPTSWESERASSMGATQVNFHNAASAFRQDAVAAVREAHEALSGAPGAGPPGAR